MERDELAAWLRLTLTPGVGNGTARKLLAAFGLPTAIFAQPANALAQVVSPALVASLRVEPPTLPAQLEATWRWLHHEGEPPGTDHRCILALGDAGYPDALLNIEDPPLMLYLMGAACVDTSQKNTSFPHVLYTKFATNIIVD